MGIHSPSLFSDSHPVAPEDSGSMSHLVRHQTALKRRFHLEHVDVNDSNIHDRPMIETSCPKTHGFLLVKYGGNMVFTSLHFRLSSCWMAKSVTFSSPRRFTRLALKVAPPGKTHPVGSKPPCRKAPSWVPGRWSHAFPASSILRNPAFLSFREFLEKAAPKSSKTHIIHYSFNTHGFARNAQKFTIDSKKQGKHGEKQHPTSLIIQVGNAIPWAWGMLPETLDVWGPVFAVDQLEDRIHRQMDTS